MFERRKIRKLLEGLEIESDLEIELGHYYWEEWNRTDFIRARDCKSLNAENTVALLWDLFQVSRHWGCEQMIWVIGTAKLPREVWSAGPSMGDLARLGRFGFWFPKSVGNESLLVKGQRHYSDGLVNADNVAIVRVSQGGYRASFCHYCNLTDLNGMHWRKER